MIGELPGFRGEPSDYSASRRGGPRALQGGTTTSWVCFRTRRNGSKGLPPRSGESALRLLSHLYAVTFWSNESLCQSAVNAFLSGGVSYGGEGLIGSNNDGC